MPQTLTTTEATALRTAERAVTDALARLRQVRQSGVTFQRTTRSIATTLRDAADTLDTVTASLGARE